MFYNMDKLCVCIVLCIGQSLSVNGQMLVSNRTGVTVTSSSKHATWSADKAIDGNAETEPNTCGCCAATTLQLNPWYKVDLGEEYTIQRIRVQGRTDYGHYLYKMEIQLGTTESDGIVLQGVDAGDMKLRELDFTLNFPQPARYITLTLRNRTDHFVICEVYVYAACFGGLYGSECVNICGECLKNESCNGVTGKCPLCTTGYQSPLCKDCIAGYYGSTCKECGQCKNNDVCDKSNGNCPNGCSIGYQRNTCEQVCTGGTHGPGCGNTCGNSKNNETCDGVTGTCSECVNGYQSPLCNDCTDGLYGSTCELCGHCNNNDVCYKINGYCPRGCSAGYQGNVCKQGCKDGTFGLGCAEKCGNCFNGVPCNIVDGRCASCAAGYKGNTCLNKCQAGTFGFNCKQRCGMCLDGDVCDLYTGECPNGCTDEYSGSQCSQKINLDSDTSISLPVFIGSLFAVVVITVTVVIGLGWLCYRKRLNKKTHKATNNVDTSIPLPNTSSNYDTLRFENPDG